MARRHHFKQETITGGGGVELTDIGCPLYALPAGNRGYCEVAPPRRVDGDDHVIEYHHGGRASRRQVIRNF